MNRYLLLILLLTSCGNPLSTPKEVIPTDQSDKIRNVAKHLRIPLITDQYIIFVPADNGCDGCLLIAKQLINDSFNKKSLTAVISGYSRKKIKSYIKTIHQKNHLVLDTVASAIACGLINEYPYIVNVKNNRFIFCSAVTAVTIDSVRLQMGLPKSSQLNGVKYHE